VAERRKRHLMPGVQSFVRRDGVYILHPVLRMDLARVEDKQLVLEAEAEAGAGAGAKAAALEPQTTGTAVLL